MEKAYILSNGIDDYAIECPVVAQTGDATIAPNTYNVWGEVAALTITKGADVDGVVNNYIIRFFAGAGCTIAFAGWELKWVGGNEPTWTEGKTYEVSIVDNLAMYLEA